MKKLFIIITYAVLLLALIAFKRIEKCKNHSFIQSFNHSIIEIRGFEFNNSSEKDWSECLEKYDSKWGDYCEYCEDYEDSYKVFLRNICSEEIDVLVSVQNETKTWQVFSRNEMKPQDTLVAYSCKGTGKYLYWVRKAGDTEVVFPSVTEINSAYKE